MISTSRRVVTVADESYPVRLRALDAPPEEVTIDGPLDLPLAGPVVAVVGSRRPTPEANAFASSLAARIAIAGGVVASGGAVGIDTAAHRGALAAGGVTWCVAPTGPANVFPRENAELFDTIVACGGTMVWPFAQEAPAYRGNFFRRNSVLAALADVLVIVQAAAPSGALNAAHHARKLGRPIWVVGGAPWDAGFTGCLSEIDRGASVLTSIDRFLEALGLTAPGAPELEASPLPLTLPGVDLSSSARSIPSGMGARRRASPPAPASPPPPRAVFVPEDPTERALLEVISTDARHVEEIAARARVCAAAASTALLTLALENVVVEGPEGFYRRVFQRITEREQ